MNYEFQIFPVFIGWFIGALLVGFAGLNRKGGFWRAFLIGMLFTPLAGIIFVVGSGKKNPKGCRHCGNKYNEAEYCGICGKNDNGDLRPGFKE